MLLIVVYLITVIIYYNNKKDIAKLSMSCILTVYSKLSDPYLLKSPYSNLLLVITIKLLSLYEKPSYRTFYNLLTCLLPDHIDSGTGNQ
jgi:hypothetical protein